MLFQHNDVIKFALFSERTHHLELKRNMKNRRLITYLVSFIITPLIYALATFLNWQGSAWFHAFLESIATLLAFFVALTALARFYSEKRYSFLFIGYGFLGTALLDGLHTVSSYPSSNVSQFFASSLPALIEWGWFVSRLFLAIFLWLSWFVWYRETKQEKTIFINPNQIFALTISCVTAVVIAFLYIPLPIRKYPGPLPNLQEIVAFLFFLGALIGYFQKKAWQKEHFEHWFMLALIINVVAEVFFLVKPNHVFDPIFNTSHLLKILSYSCMLAGVIISIYQVFRQAELDSFALSQKNDELQREIAERQQLEKHIQESLIRRTRQIQTSTEVAQEIATTPALDDLFLRVVELVQQRFGYYHAQVYTLEGGYLVMQEGTGETGRKLKEIHHRIAITSPKSMVARVAYTGSPMLVPDVLQEPDWLSNPFLPETKSEITVPIKLQSEVLGVLDVQSNQLGSLTEEDQLLLLGLCGQIAVAINNRRLEAKQKQDQEELQKYAADLERSNRELQDFAYVASHDLQEPLRMVASYVQLLSRRYKGQLDADADEFIAYAVDGATRMKSLINDLLAYSRVGTQVKEFTMLDSQMVLKQALSNLHIAIEESHAEITYDPLPVIYGDESQLMLLFQNLLANGIKFHGKAQPIIHVTAVSQDDEWLFSVRDNGIGIDLQYADRIFIIFQRLHGNREYPGTGIGLAICKKIVERHNGRIWVDSQLGQGATFYFTLPALANK